MRWKRVFILKGGVGNRCMVHGGESINSVIQTFREFLYLS